MMSNSPKGYMLRINVKELTGSDTLIGKTDGQRDMPKFVSVVLQNDSDETLLWDWDGIEIATASYFATTVVPVLKMLISGELNKYFIFVRMNRNCLDELKLVLEAEELVVMLAETRGDNVQSVKLIGKLDPAYADTFAEVVHRKQVSAAELFRDFRPKNRVRIGKTAWANRLAGLSRLRLVRKEKIGREFVFRAPFLEA
jgi:hypothetical protein